ncbi:DUF3943 domain-containing protein [Paramuribaculum intestinale]|uniref:DUF3943 domain-containing protein n=2 Tax=Paramuribaculum intestinale TaxID=2094151 RepID=A0A2V1IY74_9BACT|nr:DUF3943 domain-containing protein [Paramuribaculum intestinale]PWB12719.1 DUF3943 domain-containing protein [Paramuribaculum intestinale]ROS92198.1 DUF3943 domain-containing protein [Muribaculaceae bacterium Isolate-043 (Harlan)]
MRRITVILTVMISAVYLAAGAVSLPTLTEISIPTPSISLPQAPKVPQTLVLHRASITNDDAGADDTTEATSAATEGCWSKKPSLYDYPYSPTRSMRDWNRLWANTAVLMGGGLTALGILELLPQESTAWNSHENGKTPLFKRWLRHVKEGPVWDGDKFIFNFVLHPYAGAAYYMSARSCGFNYWGSFVYCFCISTFFWEYGFEAFNEIPSAQDIVVTSVVGSIMGEAFYHAKRHIMSNGYRIFGSRALGYVAAFFCDPVNEVLGYFRGDQHRAIRRFDGAPRSMASASGGFVFNPTSRTGMRYGLTLTYSF